MRSVQEAEDLIDYLDGRLFRNKKLRVSQFRKD
jgi:hypothetical protein